MAPTAHEPSLARAADELAELLSEGALQDVLILQRLPGLRTVLESGVDVYAHNVETVLRLTPRVRDHRCSYLGSLETLRMAKQLRPDVVTKSSLMLGLGESDRELEQAMDDLREFEVDVVTFGQYLRPSMLHLPVREHVTPARFGALEERAKAKGFLYVASGPLVRSSYKAAEYYIEGLLRRRKADAARGPASPQPERTESSVSN